MLKDADRKIISELLKNSRLSDSELARKLGTSQPTVTRKRTRLEEEGFLNYIGRPDPLKMGFTVMAFNLVSWNSEGEKLSMIRSKDFMKKVASFLNNYPNVIFASTGRGFGMGRISISLHKDYTDYVRFIAELDREWAQYLEKRESFIVSLESDNIVRNFTFEGLIEAIEQS